MSASLVGSEMCIRDRSRTRRERAAGRGLPMTRCWLPSGRGTAKPPQPDPVSYTHLTLPTICSV
eukprot:8291455-Alexandrium_andersonii.AAC.1